jgi:hypothetical protein
VIANLEGAKVHIADIEQNSDGGALDVKFVLGTVKDQVKSDLLPQVPEIHGGTMR